MNTHAGAPTVLLFLLLLVPVLLLLLLVIFLATLNRTVRGKIAPPGRPPHPCPRRPASFWGTPSSSRRQSPPPPAGNASLPRLALPEERAQIARLLHAVQKRRPLRRPPAVLRPSSPGTGSGGIFRLLRPSQLLVLLSGHRLGGRSHRRGHWRLAHR